jgi:hypothetical protein
MKSNTKGEKRTQHAQLGIVFGVLEFLYLSYAV